MEEFNITIICEISQNFSNMGEAKQLISLAKEYGGDLVKAQLFDSQKLYGEIVPSTLSVGDAKMLFDYGAEMGIEVFFSVFDEKRIIWCEKIGVKRYKVASGRCNDRQLIEALRKTGKEIIISRPDKETLFSPQFTYLYCIPEYPATLRPSDVRIMKSHPFSGFSDHTIGVGAAKIALVNGALVIEKHFAVDHKTGVDAIWSMTPLELRELKEWEKECKK